ncbi:MAG: sterol desaturase family protein [Brumimicrobium sp.]
MDNLKVDIYPNEKSPKIFNNKYLEFLTRAHPSVVNVIITSLGVGYYYFYHNDNLVQVIGGFFLGVFVWTLAEYLMHRFLYHKIKDASFNSGVQYLFHGVHHKYPTDEARLVLPPVPSLLIASLFFGFFYLIMGSFAFVFASGFLIAYLGYMNIHYRIHKSSPSRRFNFWWVHHNTHHYEQHDRAFGVSSPLWDYVFGTMPKKGRRTVYVKTPDQNDDCKTIDNSKNKSRSLEVNGF